jgi:hypothetical protein
MRRLPPLSDFLALVAERRRALGIDDEAYARAPQQRPTAHRREARAAASHQSPRS